MNASILEEHHSKAITISLKSVQYRDQEDIYTYSELAEIIIDCDLGTIPNDPQQEKEPSTLGGFSGLATAHAPRLPNIGQEKAPPKDPSVGTTPLCSHQGQGRSHQAGLKRRNSLHHVINCIKLYNIGYDSLQYVPRTSTSGLDCFFFFFRETMLCSFWAALHLVLPQMGGLPLNHSFCFWMFLKKKHPAIGGIPMTMEPPPFLVQLSSG